MKKLKSEITDIVISNATFKRKSPKIQPTFINYFFGNNGTGKSTIAKTIKSGNGVTFKMGRVQDDYDILLYDQNYIDENVKEYDGLPGVFTLNKKNVDIEKRITLLLEEQEQYKKEFDNANLKIEDLKFQEKKLTEQIKSKCWKKTKSVRTSFIKTQNGYRGSKQNFLDEVRKHKPKEHDLKQLQQLYLTAYSKSSRTYPSFDKIHDTTVLDNIPGNDILSEVIANSSNTNLANFFKKIGATEWARQGYKLFQSKSGDRCPYCSQPLNPDFESEFIKSFDDQYVSSKQKLNKFLEDYRDAANQLFVPLNQKPNPLYAPIKLEKYDDKLALIKSTITSNIEKIQLKIKEPSRIIVLEKVEPLLKELSQVIDEFNKLISENNEIVNSRAQKREECSNSVFEFMANIVNDDLKKFNSENARIAKEIKFQKQSKQSNIDRLQTIQNRIRELNRQTVETETAMNHINQMLRYSGFQGFKLVPKQAKSNVEDDKDVPTRNYKIIRTGTGQVAKNLSEGERNFIAFMYFLQQVYGKSSASEESKDKIVIIDDPVTSMDSGTVFIISAEIRKMIEICRNNVDNRANLASGNFIKQIFIFTHNAFFHRDITYSRVQEYRYVSFYLITKHDNQSEIKLCIRSNPSCPSQRINVNPVKNSYTALWKEYQETNSSITLMNVIRRILEYYFIQICSYSGDDIRKKVLVDHKSEFIDKKNDSTNQYQLASSMLAYLSAESIGINDDFLFVDDGLDVEQYRRIFKSIFKCMGQEQHFNMMMSV